MGLYDKVFQSKTKPSNAETYIQKRDALEAAQEQETVKSAIQPSKQFDEPVEPEIKPEDEQDIATLQAMDSVFTEKLNAGEFKTNADIPTHQERNEAYYQFRRSNPDEYFSFRDWMAMEQDPLAEAFIGVVKPTIQDKPILQVSIPDNDYRDGLPPGLREAQDRYQASREPQDIDVPQSINKTDILPLGTWVIIDGKEDGWQVVDYDVLQDQYKLDKGGMWETIDGNRVSVDPSYTAGTEDTGQPDLFEMEELKGIEYTPITPESFDGSENVSVNNFGIMEISKPGSESIPFIEVKPIHLIIKGDPTAQKRHRSVNMGKFTRQYDPSAADKADFLSIVQENAPETPFNCPLRVDIDFYFVRPKSHYGVGKKEGILKDNAPLWHTTRNDVDNLAKKVYDALNKVFWRDDSLICETHLKKMYSEQPRTEITITVL